MSIADEKGTPQDVSTSPEDPSLDSEIFNRGGVDEAGRFAGVHALIVDEDTNRKLRRKIDWHMLPLMGFLYMLQYLDKTTLSYASSMNLKTDINIDSAQYSWAGSMFYFGFLAFEYPHNRLMQHFPIGKYMSVAVILWGAILSSTAGVNNYAGILTTRFFLGGMEGAITAGFVLITSQWYRASEQAFRTAIWFSFNGVAQIVGGVLAYGVSRGVSENSNIHISSWKFLFVMTGCASALYGVMMWFCLADSPITAKWLTDEEKHIAVERLRGNQQGIGSRIFKWYQVKEAFTDIRTYILFLFTITTNIPNGGVTVYFTALIQSYGFSANETFLISTPAGIVQLITNLGIPYLAGRWHNRMLGACFGMGVGLFGISLMAGLAMHNPLNGKIGQLVGYYIVIGNSATALILILSVVSTNTAGYTKKTTVNAITLIGYCVGFLIGPQTFRANDAPFYYRAKYDIIAQWIIALLLCLSLYFINKRENAKRQLQLAADGFPVQPAGQEFLDLTDKENRYFRYAL